MRRTVMLSLTLSLGAMLIAQAAMALPLEQDKNARPGSAAISGRGFLGVQLAEVTHDAVGRLGLREERGALITRVTGGAAAEKAGILKDDVVVKWNGEPVESAREFSRRIAESPAGRIVKLGVLRQGKEQEITVTLGSRPFIAARVATPRVAPRYIARPAAVGRGYVRDALSLGFSMQGMSEQLAEYLGLRGRNGALVTTVHPDSAAAKAGLKAGDVILSIAGETVESPRQAILAFFAKSGSTVEVKVMRDRQEHTLNFQIEKGKTVTGQWTIDDGDVFVDFPRLAFEPFDVGPITIGPLGLESLEIPRIHVGPIPPVVVPRIQIAPIAPVVVPRMQIAPLPAVVIPEINVAPMALPRISIPKMVIPKVVVPPVRIVIPDVRYRIEV